VFTAAVEGGSYGALEEFGIKAKVVGDKLALQYSHLGKMVTESVPKAGQLQVAQKLAEILREKYGGAAEEASKGFDGTLMKMREGWSKFALQVMNKGGVFDVLKTKLREFAVAGEGTGEGTAAFAAMVSSALNGLIRIVGDLAIAAKTALPIVYRWLQWLSEPIGGLRTVALAAATVLAGAFVKSLVMAAVAFGGSIITGATFLAGVLATMTAFIVESVIPAIYAMGVALLTTPIGWIILGVTALVGAAWLLYQNWDEVTAALGRVWKWMETVASQVWKGITDTADETVSNVQQKWKAVRGFFRALFADIKRGWDATFGALGRGIDWLKDNLPSFSTLKLPSPNPDASGGGGGGSRGAGRDGRLKIDIKIDSAGHPSAGVSENDAGDGPLLDPSLGLAMSF
jgi:hypothetical protein